MWTPFEQHYLWTHILAVFLPPALLQSADSSPPSDQRSVIKENHIVYINILLQIKLSQTRGTAIQIFFIFCITVGWADIIPNLCQWGLTAYWWCIIVTFPLKNDQECISFIMWALLSKRLSQVWPKLCFLYWHSGTLLQKLHDLIKDCILGPNYKLTAPSALIPVTFSSLENTISLVFFISLYIQNLCYHFLLKRCHVIQASNQKGSRTSPLQTCCTVLKTDC